MRKPEKHSGTGMKIVVRNKPLPSWLRAHLSNPISGSAPHWVTKRARIRQCRRCRVQVWMGLDPMASATCDLPFVTIAGEAYATLLGRATYRLYGHTPSTLELEYRGNWERVMMPIGSEDSSGVVLVLVEHRCYYSFPREYRMEES